MVDLFLAGFNLSFLCLGEIQSGRSFTLLGDNQKYMGVVHFAVQTLLEKIAESNEGKRFMDPNFMFANVLYRRPSVKYFNILFDVKMHSGDVVCF